MPLFVLSILKRHFIAKFAEYGEASAQRLNPVIDMLNICKFVFGLESKKRRER